MRQVGRGRGPHQPAQTGEGAQRDGEDGLSELGLDRHRGHRALGDEGGAVHAVERVRQRAQRRGLVDVGHGDLGEAGPEPGDELRRGEAAAPEVEEVGVEVVDLGAQEVGPQLVHPGRRARQLRHGAPRLTLAAGQGRASRSTLPEVRVGRVSTTAEPRHEGGRHGGAQVCDRARGRSKPALGRDVADQHAVARARWCARLRRPPVTPGSASRALSISPSSIRRPPSLIWSSARPTNTRPSSSFRTRSPLR